MVTPRSKHKTAPQEHAPRKPSHSEEGAHFNDSPQLIYWLLICISLLLGFNTISHLDGGIGDEDVHRYQINWFINGQFEVFKYVTMIPSYHAVVAALAKLTGLTSLNGLRFVHLLFAASVIPVFYRLCSHFYPHQAQSRTLMLVFTPFLFPLFFLTYTDLPSLTFTLLMIERSVKQDYRWAAVAAFGAVLLRQPNIMWVGFTLSLIALQTFQEHYGSNKATGLRTAALQLFKREFITLYLRRSNGLIAVVMAFIAFVVINGGVALGDAEQHPISFNLSNLYFFLLVSFALFLPFAVEQVPAIFQLLKHNVWILALLAAGFALYWYTYEHPHIYNRTELGWYRHNWLLHYTADITAFRIVSFFPIAWMALSYVCAARKGSYNKQILLLIPFALLSFVPLPLIEQRYYIVSLILFLVFRPSLSRPASTMTLCYYMGLSAYILFNISRKTFFL